jgi:hypothetical protein
MALMPKPMKITPKMLAAMEGAVDWEMGAMVWIAGSMCGQLML